MNLVKKQYILKLQSNTMIQKQQNMRTFLKRIKNAPPLQQLDEVEKAIDAAVNLRVLCEQAFELGRRMREENVKELDEEVSERVR